MKAVRLAMFVTVLTSAMAGAGALNACSADGNEIRPGAADAATEASTRDDAGGDSGTADGSAADSARETGALSSTVRILAMNDFHGNLQPPSGNNGAVLARADDPIVGDGGTPSGDAGQVTIRAGGAAYVATVLKRLRAENPANVFVHAGDLTGATPLESAAFHDEPAILTMNRLGLAYNAVGNHEFDHGEAELMRYQKGGCFPGDVCGGDAGTFPGATFEYLAANVALQSGGTLFPAYDVRDVGGHKVAFVGMTLLDTPSIASPANISGLSFRPEVETVNLLVPEIRAKGAEAIVVLLHQGGFPSLDTTYDGCNLSDAPGGTNDIIVDIAKGLDPAVDVVVSAHTHRAYNCTLFGKTVVSAASYGRIVSAIDLTFDPVTRRVTRKSARNVPVTRDLKDPEVDAIVNGYLAAVAPKINRVVGHIAADLLAQPLASGESNFGDFIADSMLAATSSPTTGGAVMAFVNSGGVRADIRVAPIGTEPAGTVTYGKIFTAEPFSNILVTVTLTGAQVKAALEQQFTGRVSSPKFLQPSAGLAYTYDLTLADGQRIVAGTLLLNGVLVDPGTSYRVTLSDFVFNGGNGYPALKQGTNKLVGEVDVDALEAYFQSFGTDPAPVATPSAGRIVNAHP